MTLPIIVPAVHESSFWSIGDRGRWMFASAPIGRPKHKSGQDAPAGLANINKVFRMDRSALPAGCANSSPHRASAARSALVQRWRPLTAPPRSSVPPLEGLSKRGNQSGEGIDLHAECEWLVRFRTRQVWEALRRDDRGQARKLRRVFDVEDPFCEAVALSRSAAVWMLCAMSWRGVRHPASLWQKPMHPSTGLVRWLSEFHVAQQVRQASEIQGMLWQAMHFKEARCAWIVERMIEHTGRIALLHELCEM